LIYDRYEFDSVVPVRPLVRETVDKLVGGARREEFAEKFYTWNQTATEVCLSVCVLEPGEFLAAEVGVSIGVGSLEIVHKGGVVIRDELFGRVKPDESTWRLSGNGRGIELALAKEGVEMWPVCLKEMDRYGEYKMDEGKQVAEDSMDSSGKK
jgi:hypothetical protein